MCLIAFAYRLLPDYPLVLIANRDEFYQRPSQTMSFWEDDPDILGGRDLEAGGSWLALHRDGRLAAVTNHRNGKARQTDALSRGHLIRDYLANTESAAEFSSKLRGQMDQYGGFNLLLGDQQGLYYLSNRGGGSQALAPGLYGLSNAHLDSPWPKTEALKQRLARYLEQQPSPDCDDLLPLMWHRETAANHLLPDTGISHTWEKLLSSCFIQSPELGYGTRATTALLQHRDGRISISEQNFSAEGKEDHASFTLATG